MHNWVEIDRAALRYNLAAVRRRLGPGVPVCAVVKADAYGHGAVACARVFAAEGVGWFAVTSVEEGARLRGAGIEGRILVLAGFTPAEVSGLFAHALTPAVWDPAQVEWLAAAAPPVAGGFAIHVKLDTGMGRLGATPEQIPALLAALRKAARLRVEAIFSHLSSAESPAEEVSRAQWSQFNTAAPRIATALGVAGTLPWHMVNSAGALRFPEWGGIMARVGLALYGYAPAALPRDIELKPALSWKANVVAVKSLPAGHAIGYGMRFRTPYPMRVATVSAGYADGYRRDFSPGAAVLVGGVSAPVRGAISMDLTTVDANSAGSLALGEEVILLGAGSGGAITAADLALLAHTIPYEILCGISARVERVYVG